MKISFKRVLSWISIVIILFIIVFMGYGIKSMFELNKMMPIETKEIVDNIYSINDSYVNLFLIQSGEKYIAIDAGQKVDIIDRELNNLGIDSHDIIAVFLTHTDFDHVGAIRLFKNAKVYLSKKEEQLINGETSRFFSIIGNKIDTNNYELLEDQQFLNIENIKIQGLLIPGHTPGSMCYIINDRYLFTGDVISLKDGKINKFNKIFNMDTEMATNSIDKLIGIPNVEYIFTAHYGYSDNYISAVDNWIE